MPAPASYAYHQQALTSRHRLLRIYPRLRGRFTRGDCIVSFWLCSTILYKERLSTESSPISQVRVSFLGPDCTAQRLPIVIFGIGLVTDRVADSFCIARCARRKLIQMRMQLMTSWRCGQVVVLLCSLQVITAAVPEGTLRSTHIFSSFLYI